MIFNSNWFMLHQKRLLWLANTSFGKDILCINGNKSSLSDEKIVRILPNSITVKRSKQLVTEFRTHPKFGKRIYHAGKPLWDAFHWFDTNLANPFVPVLNLGFDSLTAYPDADPETTSCDGYAARIGVDEAWASLIGGAGNASLSDGTSDYAVAYFCSTTSNQYANLYRGFFLFDTSVLAGGTVTAATLSIKGTDKIDNTSSTPNINIYSSSPASNTNIVNADYGQTGSTAFSTAIAYGSWSTSAYNDFALNANGLAAVVTGISKFSARNVNHDVADSAPNWVSGEISGLRIAMADTAATTSDPKIVVTYTPNFSPRVIFI